MKMRINWFNIIIATLIVGLLAWWLWVLGIDLTQKWLLSCVGGFVMEIGLIGAMGITYKNNRSGIQTKIVFLILMVSTFITSFIFSFFSFAPESYCIPIGILGLICTYIGIKVYNTKE